MRKRRSTTLRATQRKKYAGAYLVEFQADGMRVLHNDVLQMLLTTLGMEKATDHPYPIRYIRIMKQLKRGLEYSTSHADKTATIKWAVS